ncbi:MAG: hypothetical protein IJ180_00090 [Bacteroidales bacterium]|nr:hypothetical protein [Bacteroidales bacterium]
MKKFFLYLTTLLFGLNLFAQMDVSFGKRFYDIADDCMDVKFIAEDNSGFYFYYCMNEYQGEGEFEYKYYLANTDTEGNIVKIAKIDFGSPNYKIEQTWRNNNLIGFILSKTKPDKAKESRRSTRSKTAPKQTGNEKLYVQYLHLKDMRLIDKPQMFLNYSYVVDSAQKPFLFSFSENKTKMIFCLKRGDTTGTSTEIKVYNNQMGLLWSKNYSLPQTDGMQLEIQDVNVNNDGDKALLAIKANAQGKKVDHKNDIAYLVYFTQFQKKEYALQIEKGWATQMKCCFNMEGSHILAGYYGNSNEKPYLAGGTFAYTFDSRRLHQTNFSKQEFKEYETDDMVAKNNDMALPSNFTTYVEELVPMVGGNVVMLGEQRFQSHIIPPKRRGEKSTGEEASFYRDLVLTNIDKTGFVTGNAFIAKRQKEFKGSNQYNGYIATRDRYGIYIMFNDHIANYKNGKYSPTRQYNSDKLRTQINFVQVYSDGSYNWQQVLRTHDMKMPLYKTLFLTNTKNILFMCHWEDNNIIGKFQTR